MFGRDRKRDKSTTLGPSDPAYVRKYTGQHQVTPPSSAHSGNSASISRTSQTPPGQTHFGRPTIPGQPQSTSPQGVSRSGPDDSGGFGYGAPSNRASQTPYGYPPSSPNSATAPHRSSSASRHQQPAPTGSPRSGSNNFALKVDGVTTDGSKTMVYGTPTSGHIRAGDALTIMRGGEAVASAVVTNVAGFIRRKEFAEPGKFCTLTLNLPQGRVAQHDVLTG